MHCQRKTLGSGMLLIGVLDQGLGAIQIAAKDGLELVAAMIQKDRKRTRDQRQQVLELPFPQDAFAAVKTHDGCKAAICCDKVAAFVHGFNVAVVLHAHLDRRKHGDKQRFKFIQHDLPFPQISR